MIKLRSTIDKALSWALIILMAVSVVNVLWQVFSRYVLSNPSSFTDELARYLLIWIGLLGAAYVAGKRMHLAIDLLTHRLSKTSKHRLSLFIDACIFLFSLFVLVIGGMNLVFLMLQLGQTSAALQIPLGHVYLALPISGLLMMFYAALDMSGSLKALREVSNPATD